MHVVQTLTFSFAGRTESWEVPLEFGDWEEYEAALDLLIMEGVTSAHMVTK